MSTVPSNEPRPAPKPGAVSPSRVLILAGIAIVLALSVSTLFSFGIEWMLEAWKTPQYSHGYFIPVVACYLVWLRARDLVELQPTASWLGVAVVVLALLINALGDLSAVVTISEYALLLAAVGLGLAAAGTKGMRVLAVPLLYLVFMVPWPNFLETRLTSQLQLLSSELGVAVIRLAGYSVFLEGNVIDLGNYKLQVAEACSGMRYLFPLMSFGFLSAVLFRGRWWQRAILFLSTVPITILMNSFRIGVIGILVNNFGIEQAEGFIHDFEGWVVFMACVGLLFLEIWIFARMNGRRFLEIFGLDVPAISDLRPLLLGNSPSRPLLVSTGILLVAAAGAFLIPRPVPLAAERAALATFPLRVGNWEGRDQDLEKIYLDTLQVTDYLMANFSNPAEPAAIGLWIAYYDAQIQGISVHSPQACLPGGGWRIDRIAEHEIANVLPDGAALRVNRVEISLGEQRQVVYYWFDQRGRTLTSEFAVKWYIFRDGLMLNRTDGALVRLVTPVEDPANIGAADARLEAFVRSIHPKLAYYLPGASAPTRPALRPKKVFPDA
jgi:exosortase D (VPLPA-CTERM-specific)